MILFYDIIEILDLADGNGSTVLLIVALDRCLIGRTPIDGDLRWYAVAADGLGQESLGGLLVTFRGEEKVDRLARFIDGAIEIAPLAPDLDVCLVHPPADPHRALTPVKGFLQQGTVLHHPALDGFLMDWRPP